MNSRYDKTLNGYSFFFQVLNYNGSIIDKIWMIYYSKNIQKHRVEYSLSII